MRRIKPHAPPLVRAPVNSFEFQPCDRTPQAECSRVNRGSQDPAGPKPQHSSFRAWTRRVSNPRRSPRFRASASGRRGGPAFALGVPPHLCAFHRSTGHSRPLPTPPRSALGDAPRRGIPAPRVPRTLPPTRPVRPVLPNNARPLRLTAAAGTE